MVEPTKKVWLDGRFVDWNDAQVPILTHTLHYGVGVFEGIRCYRLHDGGSAIFRLKEHVRRMSDGLKILKMEPAFSEEEVAQACVEVVRANELDECYLRPLMFCGDGAMGLAAVNTTRVAVACWKWGAYLGKEALESGTRLKVSSFNRHHVNVGMVQGKIIGQYVPSSLAKREAIAGGYDEAIMLDTQGYVAECSGENLFAVRDGVIRTAPTYSPILPGITRDTIITLCREMDLPVREERFTRDHLYLCDEVFIVGTAAEVTPVREIDDRCIGAGRPGPITKRLQDAYFDLVRGKNERHRSWLTMI